jgi:hypothetical protein
MLSDIKAMNDLLTQHGTKINEFDDFVDGHSTKTYSYRTKEIESLVAPYDYVRKMRASYYVLGPLLARYGKCELSLPGGCAIGARPMDIHLSSLEKMGAKIEIKNGYIHANVDGRLKGAHIIFPGVSVGATCNVLMAAVLAEGRTVLENSAKEPEIGDLARLLNAMGAKIIRVWLGNADSEKTAEADYQKLVKDAKSMCAVAAQYGLEVCSECHGNTYNNNTDAFLKIRADVGHNNFTTYFQSLYRKQDYDLDRIERTLPYISCVHVSYFEQFREQFPKRNPLYMDKLLKKLSDCGYDGDVLVEFVFFSYRYGVLSSLKKELNKLKKYN